MNLPLPLVAVEGTPAECGAAYGAQAASLVAGNTAAYLDRFAEQAGLAPAEVRRAGAAFRQVTLEAQPRVAAMLDGLAEGARVAVEEIYALNARTELLYGATECTSLGVISDTTVLAQNWDWHPDQRPYALLLATRDERGFAVLTLAEAGMLGKAGLNSAGLGLCVNMLMSDRDGRGPGVPYHVLVRAVLESHTLGGAIEVICGSPRSASINMLIGQAFGPSVPGEVIDVEVAPGDVGFLHPVDGVITHANHFESSIGVRDTLKDLGSSSFFRGARARRLLGASPGVKEIHAVLADHGGYPRSICRHDTDDRVEPSETLSSVVLHLDERRMSVTAGPPCAAGGYADVRLDSL